MRKLIAYSLIKLLLISFVGVATVNGGEPGSADKKGRAVSRSKATVSPISKSPESTVTIGGIVATQFGIGIPNATIVLMDMDGNIRHAISASFGFFTIPNVAPGRLYVISVRHPRYIFAFPAEVIEVHKSRMDFAFIGERHLD